MSIREIIPNIYSVGVIDWSRTLFDGLIPLPYGTSYNSYIVKGSQKTALIDAVEPTEEYQLLNNLKRSNIGEIDYIISNHAEQDHSGAIVKVLEIYPNAKVVTNKKCKDMLKDLLLIQDDKFIVVEDEETLSLGDKTIKFLLAPWVHWPETMFSYLLEDEVLFSGDFLGSHIATSDLFAKDLSRVYDSSKRYYAQIMMPFRNNIKAHLEKIEKLNVKYICPTHGVLHDNPKFILDAYKEWNSDVTKNEVVIPYISMHGSTKLMVDYLTDCLINRGITVRPYDLTNADLGEIAMSLVDASTVIVASPTVLVGPHPKVVYGTSIINALRPNTKYIGIIGSYGWGGKMTEILAGLITNLKCELFEPVLAKGQPKDEDYKNLEQLADKIYEKHKQLNVLKED